MPASLVCSLSVITNLAGFLLGFDKKTISKGVFGFNSLLVGLGLGIYFEPGIQLLLIILLGAILTLLISVSLQGVIGKYALPYLSIPFLLSIWIMTLATKEFATLGISERGIYTFNDLYTIGGDPLVRDLRVVESTPFARVSQGIFYLPGGHTVPVQPALGNHAVHRIIALFQNLLYPVTDRDSTPLSSFMTSSGPIFQN